MRGAVLSLLGLLLVAAGCAVVPRPGTPNTSLAAPERQGLPDPAPLRLIGLMAVILTAGVLASCAFLRPNISWVEIGAEGDAGPLSDAIVAFTLEALPQSGTAIALTAPPEEQAANPLTAQLRSKLAARGYKLDPQSDTPQHRLGYQVTPYAEQTLLRISLDGLEVSRLFTRNAAGTLVAVAPLAMRRKEDL